MLPTARARAPQLPPWKVVLLPCCFQRRISQSFQKNAQLHRCNVKGVFSSDTSPKVLKGTSTSNWCNSPSEALKVSESSVVLRPQVPEISEITDTQTPYTHMNIINVCRYTCIFVDYLVITSSTPTVFSKL